MRVRADLCGLTSDGLLLAHRVLADSVPVVGDPITVVDLFGADEYPATVVEIRPGHRGDLLLLDVDWD